MTRPALPANVRRAVIAHARREYPRECCGFLIGHRERVLHALPLPNVDSRPRVRFRIDDRHHIEVRRMLRRFQPPLAIVGVYHSHPDGPAEPSAADCREANYSAWIFAVVAVSRLSAQVKLFKIRGGRAHPFRRRRSR